MCPRLVKVTMSLLMVHNIAMSCTYILETLKIQGLSKEENGECVVAVEYQGKSYTDEGLKTKLIIMAY